LNIQSLTKTGSVMPNPVSGRVFFIFKIDSVATSDTASIAEAFLLHDKGHERMKAGQLKDAYSSFEKAVAVSESIISSDSKNADAYFVKAVSAGLMGHIQLQIDGAVDKALLPMSMQSWKKLLEVAPAGYNSDRLRVAKQMVSKYPDLM
jgi:hypothetical protein